MTRVDFYLQQAPASASLEMLVCRLVDKVFRQGRQAYILTPDPASSARLDELLWTFSAGSFIPHAMVVDDRAESPVPVLIGHLEPPAVWQDVLVTLRPEIAGCFSRFERVAEFVGTQDDDKERARERFRFYRDRGYPLETHEI
jgi:DNA polymerase III subunit chi